MKLKKKYFPKIILSGRALNESMGSYVAMQTAKILKSNKVKLKNARVAILGFAFKDNIPDIRNTKITQIVEKLNKLRIKFDIFDPIISKEEVRKKFKIEIGDFKNLKKINMML